MANAKGIDISHWQGGIDFAKVKKDGVEFCIMKATQGTTFVDNKFKDNQKGCRMNGILAGYYHFAQGLDAVKEADFFVQTIGELKEGELVALDWEIAHPNPVTWCKTFLDRVQKLVGFKPLFYTNSARLYAYNWQPVIDGNYGLWVAQYGLNICVATGSPRIGKWSVYAIWQYCSRGRVSGISGNCDMNKANMDLETLKKYGQPKVCSGCCPIHCPK